VTLKGVHLTFIAASAVLATWLGFWCLGLYRRDHAVPALAGMLASFAAATGLAVYGAAFWRKAKRL
jgi:hypothetical protein